MTFNILACTEGTFGCEFDLTAEPITAEPARGRGYALSVCLSIHPSSVFESETLF